MALLSPLVDPLANQPVNIDDVPVMIETFVTRRLRCLSRMLGVTDMTTATVLSFAGKVSAVNSLVEKYNVGDLVSLDCLITALARQPPTVADDRRLP